MTQSATPAFSVTRNMRGELEAVTDFELQTITPLKRRIARLTTCKRSRPGVACILQVGIHEADRGTGFVGFTVVYAPPNCGGDFSAILAQEPGRCTEAAIRRVHAAGIAAWPAMEAEVRKRYGLDTTPAPAEQEPIRAALDALPHAFSTVAASL